jgi:O-antigen/teichoic acid export membrane protein
MPSYVACHCRVANSSTTLRMKLLPTRLATLLGQRPTLSKVLANIAWLILDKALKLAVGIAVTAWLARYLGPESFGTYSYVIAFAALFSGFATLGLPTIVVRELVREAEESMTILGSTAVLLLGAGALSAGLVCLAAGLLRPDDVTLRTAVAIVAGALLFQSSTVVRCWFESQISARYVVVAENLALFVSAVVRVVLIVRQASLEAFFWVLLAEAALLAALLLAAYVRRTGDLRHWRVTRARAWKLLRDSWPLALSGGVLMVQARADQFMLAEMAGDRHLGYYSVALRVAEGLTFFSVALQSSLFPVLVEARQQSAAAFREKLLTFYRATALAALAVCVPLACLAPWLVEGVFGQAYAPAGMLLALMSGRILLAFVGTARNVYLTIENMQSHATLTLVAGTALNVVLNLLWIPSHQALGAVWASLVSFAVTSFFIDLLFPRVRGNALDMLRALATLHLVWKR